MNSILGLLWIVLLTLGTSTPLEEVHLDANNLSECQGDCDTDDDCMGDLKCFQRTTGLYNPPGCEGIPYSSWDYCYDPSNPLTEVDINGNNLGKCQGDCDSDDDCVGDLKCFQRQSDDPNSPGCEGIPYSSWDYCYNPTDVTTGVNDIKIYSWGKGMDKLEGIYRSYIEVNEVKYGPKIGFTFVSISDFGNGAISSEFFNTYNGGSDGQDAAAWLNSRANGDLVMITVYDTADTDFSDRSLPVISILNEWGCSITTSLGFRDSFIFIGYAHQNTVYCETSDENALLYPRTTTGGNDNIDLSQYDFKSCDFYESAPRLGHIPTICPSNKPDKDGGLCYPDCNSGYKDDGGALCWQICSSNYVEVGFTCVDKNAPWNVKVRDSYSRGFGVIPSGCCCGRHNDAGLCYDDCPSHLTPGILGACTCDFISYIDNAIHVISDAKDSVTDCLLPFVNSITSATSSANNAPDYFGDHQSAFNALATCWKTNRRRLAWNGGSGVAVALEIGMSFMGDGTGGGSPGIGLSFGFVYNFGGNSWYTYSKSCQPSFGDPGLEGYIGIIFYDSLSEIQGIAKYVSGGFELPGHNFGADLIFILNTGGTRLKAMGISLRFGTSSIFETVVSFQMGDCETLSFNAIQ